MSTTFTALECAMDKKTKMEVYTGLSIIGSVVKLFIYDKDTENGRKLTLTEETWRELITALETAGNSIGWEE